MAHVNQYPWDKIHPLGMPVVPEVYWIFWILFNKLFFVLKLFLYFNSCKECHDLGRQIHKNKHDSLLTGLSVGKRTPLIDANWKVTGQAKYGDDIPMEYHPIIRSHKACYLSSSKASLYSSKSPYIRLISVMSLFSYCDSKQNVNFSYEERIVL